MINEIGQNFKNVLISDASSTLSPRPTLTNTAHVFLRVRIKQIQSIIDPNVMAFIPKYGFHTKIWMNNE